MPVGSPCRPGGQAGQARADARHQQRHAPRVADRRAHQNVRGAVLRVDQPPGRFARAEQQQLVHLAPRLGQRVGRPHLPVPGQGRRVRGELLGEGAAAGVELELERHAGLPVDPRAHLTVLGFVGRAQHDHVGGAPGPLAVGPALDLRGLEQVAQPAPVLVAEVGAGRGSSEGVGGDAPHLPVLGQAHEDVDRLGPLGEQVRGAAQVGRKQRDERERRRPPGARSPRPGPLSTTIGATIGGVHRFRRCILAFPAPSPEGPQMRAPYPYPSDSGTFARPRTAVRRPDRRVPLELEAR